jgi:copper chaperone CopZ
MENKRTLHHNLLNKNQKDMSEKILKFKTNINCSGCVAQATPFLDAAIGHGHWDVDTSSKDKILTVHSEGITEAEVIQKVLEAGFKIELLTS